MTRGRAVAWALAALLLAGCAREAARPPPTPAPAGSTIDRADLALARTLWASAAAAPYALTVETAGVGADVVATVEVADGRVRSARQADGRPAPDPAATLTVERLFELVEEGLAGVDAGRVHRLEVMFDGHHGLPIDVQITERAGGPIRRYIVRQYAPLPP
jgi:hypothetical protein